MNNLKEGGSLVLKFIKKLFGKIIKSEPQYLLVKSNIEEKIDENSNQVIFWRRELFHREDDNRFREIIANGTKEVPLGTSFEEAISNSMSFIHDNGYKECEDYEHTDLEDREKRIHYGHFAFHFKDGSTRFKLLEIPRNK